jgi:hypothetical protein
VLPNQASGLVLNALVYRGLDHRLDAKAPDSVGIYGRLPAENRAKLAQRDTAAVAAHDSTDGPSLALARYAETYRDAWYRDVSIADLLLRPVDK